MVIMMIMMMRVGDDDVDDDVRSWVVWRPDREFLLR